MDIQEHMHPDRLEKYSFMWSEARLLIAAVALCIGGVPVLRAILPIPALYGLVGLVLTLAWLISGAASLYLLYRWHQNKWMVFGGKMQLDMIAFGINVVTGINLGLAGLLGRNIGMSLFPVYIIFVLAGVAYLATAYHLWKQWKAHGMKVF